jgi:predicted PurR-regulated permease PerM
VALSIIAINQITDNLISPKVVGRAVGLHPAISILSLLIGGKLFGLAGMVLAVPVAASIRIMILEIRPELKVSEEKQPEPFLRKLIKKKLSSKKKQA